MQLPTQRNTGSLNTLIKYGLPLQHGYPKIQSAIISIVARGPPYTESAVYLAMRLGQNGAFIMGHILAARPPAPASLPNAQKVFGASTLIDSMLEGKKL